MKSVLEKTEVKKLIYKNNPTAIFRAAGGGGLSYTAAIPDNTLYFFIPFRDIVDAKFEMTMPAKLLIRWLQ